MSKLAATATPMVPMSTLDVIIYKADSLLDKGISATGTVAGAIVQKYDRPSVFMAAFRAKRGVPATKGQWFMVDGKPTFIAE
jgi:hypothetical protein